MVADNIGQEPILQVYLDPETERRALLQTDSLRACQIPRLRVAHAKPYPVIGRSHRRCIGLHGDVWSRHAAKNELSFWACIGKGDHLSGCYSLLP